jgi:diguanylate cyclase (GGDEF)-like protein
MSESSRTSRKGLQALFLKRFAMAQATYGLVMAVSWVAVFTGLYRYSPTIAAVCWLAVAVSQALFLLIIWSGHNLRFEDPSLTEPQVLVALAWLAVMTFSLTDGHGAVVSLYVLALLFAAFSLRLARFVRCAVLAFCSFAGARLAAAQVQQDFNAGVIVLQVSLFLVVLIWLCLGAGYVGTLRRRMHQRRYALKAHQDTLRGMMRQLEDLASTDELTGLFNRRHFLRLAEQACLELMPGARHGLALIDLDHFKRINDLHGHAAGDRVLQTFASVARACVREGDVLARYGGEEFVLLIPETNGDAFAACCERLRESFAGAEPVDVPGSDLSLSIGMTLIGAGDALDEALQRADQALYRAKREGRNRCAAAWESYDA